MLGLPQPESRHGVPVDDTAAIGGPVGPFSIRCLADIEARLIYVSCAIPEPAERYGVACAFLARGVHQVGEALGQTEVGRDRVDERVASALTLVESDFDYSKEESVVIDPDETTYAKSPEEAQDRCPFPF